MQNALLHHLANIHLLYVFMIIYWHVDDDT